MEASSTGTTSGPYDQVRESLSKLQDENTGLNHLQRNKNTTIRAKNREELLHQELEYLHNELSRKEDDLKLSAEIGQQLLQQVEHGVNVIEELKGELESETEEREKLFRSKGETEKQLRRMKIILEEVEQQRDELQEEITRVQEEANQKGKKHDSGEVNEEQIQMEEKIKALSFEVRKLEKENLNRNNTIRNMKEEMADMESDMQQMKDRMRELEEAEKELQRMKSKVKSLAKLKESVQELEWENSQLNQTLREVTIEYERLQGDSLLQHLEEECDYMRSYIEALKKRNAIPYDMLGGIPESPEAGPSPSPSPAGPAGPGSGAHPAGSPHGMLLRSPSLADELESVDEEEDIGENLKRNLHRDFESSVSVTTTTPTMYQGVDGTDSSAKRRSGGLLRQRDWERTSEHPLQYSGHDDDEDDEEDPTLHYDDKAKEFFFLTALSIKLNQGDRLEDVQTISTKQLYRKAAKLKIPFHMFHGWLNREIVHAYIGRIYDSKQAEANSSNERSETQKKLGVWGRLKKKMGYGGDKDAKRSSSMQHSQSMGGIPTTSSTGYAIRRVPSRRHRLHSTESDNDVS